MSAKVGVEERKNALAKKEQLVAILKEMESVLIAFSGGVDSTFLLSMAREVLGRERILAVTAYSPTFPRWEGEEARELVATLDVPALAITTDELAQPEFAANPPDRCYFCKRTLFAKLKELAAARGLKWVADGANVDDQADFRPGRRAARELGTRSPLEEAGLTKEEIRLLSREMGLPTWDKPAYACLASRFPYGTPITAAGLTQVEAAESFLHGLGLRWVRVRVHGDLARIEVAREELGRAFAQADAINARLKELGFLYVALDLEGYRQGSMNAPLAAS